MRERAFVRQPVVSIAGWIRRVAAGAALCSTGPAFAEIAGTIEIKSDDRYRGRSLSGGQPAITGDLSIDDAAGVYAGASITATIAGEQRAGLRGGQAYVGYAKRLKSGLTIDAGATAYAYTRRSSLDRAATYGEVYAGMTAGKVSAYFHYTPNYLGRGIPVAYVDVTVVQPLPAGFTVTAHAGLAAQTSGPARLGGTDVRYDARVALVRPFRGLEAAVAWTFAGPDNAEFIYPWGGQSSLTISLAKHF